MKGKNLMRAISSSMVNGNDGDPPVKKISEEEKAKMKADPKFVQVQAQRKAQADEDAEIIKDLKEKKIPVNKQNIQGAKNMKKKTGAVSKSTGGVDYMK
jgi:hypothetical protein